MISFIIIGRNEAKNIKKALDSVFDAISLNELLNYEVIYIDSKSKDHTLKIVQEFSEVMVFQITGECNAAIARNVGAKESSGTTLFFIDGDMEIRGEFLLDVLSSDGTLNYDLVSGQLIDVVNGVKRTRYSNSFLGGIFLIKKEIWMSVSGMTTKYQTGEDLDLGLRLANKGITLHRKNSVITTHYTVDTFDKSRMWKMIWNKSAFYARSVLYRDHLFSKHMYKKLWMTDKTLIPLFLALASFPFSTGLSYCICLLYFSAVVARSFKQTSSVPKLNLIVYYLLLNFLTIIYFFTFFPKKVKEEYTQI